VAGILFSLQPRIFILTLLAMVAFASNSLLCRAALKQSRIDAASFTFVRIFSGAAVLWIIIEARKRFTVDRQDSATAQRLPQTAWIKPGNWTSAFALFTYAACFSFAYNTLSAGTGALLLFSAVQATMIFWGLRKGEHLDAVQIAGLVVAMTGLIVLLFPGLSAPPLIGSVLMIGAGVAWGVYSLRGATAGDAIAATAGSFLRTIPFAILTSLLAIRSTHLGSLGFIYAITSGALTSGLGYVIWYTALPGLKATSAAAVQLSVPVLAATGGILFLHESITMRYVLASLAVLGGIFLVVIEKRQPA
jgi:drug/metabolite transporter (DMT)-like permease